MLLCDNYDINSFMDFDVIQHDLQRIKDPSIHTVLEREFIYTLENISY